MGISMKPPAQKRGAVDHAAVAKRLRERAEECRALARVMTSAAIAASYLRFADIYDALAKQEEQIAFDSKINDVKR
jgi:hypothetical protein